MGRSTWFEAQALAEFEDIDGVTEAVVDRDGWNDSPNLSIHLDPELSPAAAATAVTAAADLLDDKADDTTLHVTPGDDFDLTAHWQRGAIFEPEFPELLAFWTGQVFGEEWSRFEFQAHAHSRPWLIMSPVSAERCELVALGWAETGLDAAALDYYPPGEGLDSCESDLE